LRIPKAQGGLSDKGGKSNLKEIPTDAASAKADEDREAVKQKGKGKAKAVQTPAKVNLSFFGFSHYH
jgi:hypothetical protein